MRILFSSSIRRLVTIGTILLLPRLVLAEEGGSGQFLPGSFSSMLDLSPSDPGFAASGAFYFYTGDASASKALPFGGIFALGLEADVALVGVGASYTFQEKFLGAHYSVSALLPFLWMNVQATGELNPALARLPAIQRRQKDSNRGLTDMLIVPVGLNWKLQEDFQVSFQLPIYIPTGSYTEGRLANLGKNIWTFGPTVGVNWFNPKVGLEVTSVMGMQFATKNEATDYQNGIVFNWEGTIAQYLPIPNDGGVFGLGVTWLIYQQITDDSGAGARLGGFRSELMGVGPCMTIIHPIGDTKLVANIKFLPEIATENRLHGNNFWVTLGMAF